MPAHKTIYQVLYYLLELSVSVTKALPHERPGTMGKKLGKDQMLRSNLYHSNSFT